jgi:hypothetical protein
LPFTVFLQKTWKHLYCSFLICSDIPVWEGRSMITLFIDGEIENRD